VLEAFNDSAASSTRVLRIGLPDAFPKEYGSQETMFETFGQTPNDIVGAVRKALTS